MRVAHDDQRVADAELPVRADVARDLAVAYDRNDARSGLRPDVQRNGGSAHRRRSRRQGYPVNRIFGNGKEYLPRLVLFGSAGDVGETLERAMSRLREKAPPDRRRRDQRSVNRALRPELRRLNRNVEHHHPDERRSYDRRNREIVDHVVHRQLPLRRPRIYQHVAERPAERAGDAQNRREHRDHERIGAETEENAVVPLEKSRKRRPVVTVEHGDDDDHRQFKNGYDHKFDKRLADRRRRFRAA